MNVTDAMNNLRRELERDDPDKVEWLLDAIDELIRARIAEAIGTRAADQPSGRADNESGGK